jgi:hybrid cluster-associated redox disulfide protein
MANPPKITKHMMLSDVAMQYPDTAHIFFKYGLHCIGCHVAMFETIEQGAMAHGLTAEDVDNLVKELNDAISKKEKK